jgi:molecular chaperone GrpE
MNKHHNEKENNEKKHPESELQEIKQNDEELPIQDEVTIMEGEPVDNPGEKISEQLESKLKDIANELAAIKDKLLRERAEFDNFRKRMVKEKNDININSQFNAISTIVPVLDHFELALTSAEQTNNLKALLEGMELIKAEFERALSSLGVEYIHAIGSKFNPMYHESISSEESNEHEKDVIVRQWRTGYKIGDRVIRPASVVVSSGKPKATEPQKN